MPGYTAITVIELANIRRENREANAKHVTFKITANEAIAAWKCGVVCGSGGQYAPGEAEYHYEAMKADPQGYADLLEDYGYAGE